MVAISFSVMKDKLLSGEKTHTIRKLNINRLHQMAKLKKLQIYWKLRTKETEKLFDAEFVGATIFNLDSNGYPWAWVGDDTYPFACNNVSPVDADLIKFPINYATSLALEDGFDSIEDMQKWFVSKYNDRVSGDYMGIRFRKITT